MSIFIKTLKNMYTAKKIDISKIKQMLNDKKITAKEYEYIIK